MKHATPNRRVIDLSRRQILRGAGGVSLSLPVLTSLLTKNAYGADPVFKRRPRLFWITTDHGGAYESNMFPSPSLLTEKRELFPGHTVQRGALAKTVVGAQAVVSPILRADATILSDAMVAKMNVLWGLDIPFYIAHNTGGHLGNYARNDGNGGDGAEAQKSPRPTIDQIMAFSPSFYPDLGSIRERSMLMSSRPVSFNYSNPSTASGTIDNVRGVESSLELFDRIFVPPKTATGTRAPIVDRVLESYQALRNGNRRLSQSDKQRLDDHMDRIHELQRKLNAQASCGSVKRPTDDATHHLQNDADDAARYGQAYAEVVTAAFICGTSRIGVLGLGGNERFASYAGDWHQEVAHQWQKPEKQTLLVAAYQKIFESVFLDVARRLDIEEAPGVSYLDNSLLVWTQECCQSTHDSVSLPVVTVGSAAGFFKTGQLVDYRRMGNADSKYDPGAGGTQWLGLLYNQWLATVLQAMGVPPAEFERWGHKGYGVPLLTKETWTPPYAKHYESTSSRYFQAASDVLPFLQAAT